MTSEQVHISKKEYIEVNGGRGGDVEVYVSDDGGYTDVVLTREQAIQFARAILAATLDEDEGE